MRKTNPEGDERKHSAWFGGRSSWFGPPSYVKEACNKWCDRASVNPEAKKSCVACNGGPQINPECIDRECDYCKREIAFPRHYPKLWLEETSFNGKMLELE